jgi:hypothetical protein
MKVKRMKALGAALEVVGVCSLAAVGLSVFGLAQRIFGHDFLAAPLSQFIAFVFGVALIASGAVFRRFDDIMKFALDVARDVTKDMYAHDEPDAAPNIPVGNQSFTTKGLKTHDKSNAGD